MTPRIRLKMEDGFFGNFQLDDKGSLVAPILDFSIGGFYFAISKKTGCTLKHGEQLKLVRILGTANLNFISDIPAEIIAINEQYVDGYISAACKFLELADEARKQIIRFVDNERQLRGQYG